MQLSVQAENHFQKPNTLESVALIDLGRSVAGSMQRCRTPFCHSIGSYWQLQGQRRCTVLSPTSWKRKQTDLWTWRADAFLKAHPFFLHISISPMQVEVSSKQICWHAVILPRSLALFTCLKHHSYISAIRIDFLFFFFFFGLTPDGDTGRQDSPLRMTRHWVITLSPQADALLTLLQLLSQVPQPQTRFSVSPVKSKVSPSDKKHRPELQTSSLLIASNSFQAQSAIFNKT